MSEMKDAVDAWLDKEATRYVNALYGGVPAGMLFGMPVLINYDMPNDRIRIIEAVSGKVHEIVVPDA